MAHIQSLAQELPYAVSAAPQKNTQKRKDLVYIHDGILPSHKKEILPFATMLMDRKVIRLSEVSQTQNKYCMVSLICGILKK